MSIETFKYPKTFTLECGKKLPGLEVGYHTYGKLNKSCNNVIWVCHALTANSDVMDWWHGLFGKDDLFNPDEHYIVCANILGSPYGTVNPLSVNPLTGQPYYLSFPQFTIRDIVHAHQLLAQYLGVDQINVIIGGSLGGQQALEWSIIEPERINNLVLLATNAKHSPWGIAFNESQRLAISTDRTFYANTPDGGSKGLKAARSFALLSYRGYETYDLTQQDNESGKLENYRASSYQNYQGEKLVKRFNAYSYWYLTKTMDSHNVGRGRESLEKALSLVKAKTLVVGVKSDILFPVAEQQYLAKHIPNALYVEFESVYGHDSFLIETKTISKIIDSFLGSNFNGKVIKMQTA